ncbi:Altered inheritance of mitochondria protein 32 [Psilocybe cubensis]|uniref:Altered inheritance of mitochondria protein 32 n=2 Tax=Psilocybe cubensis TaxID=181762 RepID=A0ACB8GM46_PSICU|nr:Altered inheritance of mitochondria protein 32 [Psilocybe cubensis]KAH9476090.1 Altered inheritance of mitochondria protein 32 [Psilocybe cubensis]
MRHCRTFLTRRTEISKPPEYYEGRLEGTAPEHQCYIFLHASQSPELFPKVQKTSVSLELQARATRWGGIVNFSWFNDGSAPQMIEKGLQPATVFSRLGGKLEIPDVSLENIDQVEDTIKTHLQGPSLLTEGEKGGSDIHIYVCTHGVRDCRCGERGKQVYNALVKAVNDARQREPIARNIRIGEVGHVGGHKYAANVLIYPQGEWLGIVKPDDAPSLINQALESLRKGVKPLDSTAPPTFLSHWRGRMGLSKEEQKNLWAKHAGIEDNHVAEKELRPIPRS